MVPVKIHYLSGDEVRMDSPATVGSIMTHVAMEHSRFASDVAVVCLDTGKDLTNSPSQAPPSTVSVVLKLAGDLPSKDDLRLTLMLHAEHEDTETCTHALEVLRRFYPAVDADRFLLSALDYDHEMGQKVIRTLLRAGVNGASALRQVCRVGEKKAVEMFLAAGVSPDVVTDEGHTALMDASIFGRNDMVDTLLSNGAQVDLGDQCGRTALMLASMHGRNDVVETLLSNGAEVNREDQCGRTALIIASMHGRDDVVKTLLSNGAQVGRVDQCGRTALMGASMSGYKGVVETLLSNGAQVEGEDHGGITALMGASMYGCEDVVKMLLSNGAQVDREDQTGDTA